MTWNMNDREFEAVLALAGDRRYAYFVKRTADWELVWSLATSDGWALAGDDEGHELVPVWPHAKFAAVCANDHWAGFEPQAIPLATWIDRWTPGMQRDGRRVAVFPTPAHKGVVVSPDRLKDDLEAEMSLYEQRKKGVTATHVGGKHLGYTGLLALLAIAPAL